jgi:hypothetical protein
MGKSFVGRLLSCVCLALFFSVSVSAQQTPTMAEMWEIIQRQQQEINELRQALGQTNSKVEETEVKVIATADAVESAVSSAATGSGRTNIGGYGELHYNRLDNELAGGEDLDRVDFHRFVLFFSHQFSDSVSFFSEFELEHSLAGDGAPGEVELEQAYIQWNLNENSQAKAGLFLVPVGILNETHEPTTFYGVERNGVEGAILPSTWWEAGGGFSAELAPGWNYDVAIHSGLFMEDGRVRQGRQKVAEAKADDFAYTGRIRYTGIAGLEVGLSLQHQSDVLQSDNISGASDISGFLTELHASYQHGPFGLRALYASWDFDSEIEMLRSGAEEQEGYYFEPSFRINDRIGVFARYSQWDIQAADSVDSEITQTDFGVNYWLTEGVVFKADYQDQDTATGSNEFDGFNLGFGYAF